MSDFFDNFNKILKEDLGPILGKYLNDPNNTISDKNNNFFNNPRIFLTDIFEKFSKYKVNDTNQDDHSANQNLTDREVSRDNEYNELLERLILIEDNMIQLEKILKEKN